jgi:L-histidine Nalpha-methyltransferase
MGSLDLVSSPDYLHDRFQWMSLDPTELEQIDQGADVIYGLSQSPKTLPCQYFYDDRGSLLFEQICTLPEYYPTRTEREILTNCAAEVATLTGSCELIELGSGSSSKTQLLLDAYSPLTPCLKYCPIDVSGGILKTSALDLLNQYQNLQICGLVGTYEQALETFTKPADWYSLTRINDPRLLMFLGSTIGNLPPQAYHDFLAQVKNALQPGDYFLLGVDLQKAPEVLEPAYNDRQGVTAEFNLNLLRHLNWRFQANFDLNQFQHCALYNTTQHQIEMHLKSLVKQQITLKSLDFQITLDVTETIRTEISRKFHLPTLLTDLQQHQLHTLKTWTDSQQWFAVVLCQRQGRT